MHMEKSLPAIPAKRYFTIGEVSDLCGVKPYVLRYWEQEFSQLKPMKRRGNRRYYQHHEVLLIRRIRELLYDQGFTISGARNRLADLPAERELPGAERLGPVDGPDDDDAPDFAVSPPSGTPAVALAMNGAVPTEAITYAFSLDGVAHHHPGSDVNGPDADGIVPATESVRWGRRATDLRADEIDASSQDTQGTGTPGLPPLGTAELRAELLAIRSLLLA
jgi:DNA-binding transcriptional MerR regulator